MTVELSNGKAVRGVNSARGLERAAYDYNSGAGRGHLHVALGLRTKFLCSNRPLSVGEIDEAETLLEKAYLELERGRQELREKLLGQDGDRFIAERQGAVADGNTAPRDIRGAVFEGGGRNNNIKWAEVKGRILLLRESASTP